MGTEVDTLSYTVFANKNRPLLHNIQLHTDTVGTIDGTVTVDIELYGRVFPTDDWTSIDDHAGEDVTDPLTVDFYSDLSEVIDTMEANTSPFYRQYKVEITFNTTTGLDAGEQIKVQHFYWKFYER